jgi:hypothetical protein
MDLTNKVTVIRSADPFTARELREMVESRAWLVYQARLDLIIHAQALICESAADPDAWRKAQGALEALRRVKLLPAVLAEEMSTLR